MTSERGTQETRHPFEALEEDKQFAGLLYTQKIAVSGFMQIMIGDARARILNRGEPEGEGVIEAREAVLKRMGISDELIKFVKEKANAFALRLKELGLYYVK